MRRSSAAAAAIGNRCPVLGESGTTALAFRDRRSSVRRRIISAIAPHASAAAKGVRPVSSSNSVAQARRASATKLFREA